MLLQLHGFCDASENTYGGVIYLRMIDISDQVHIPLVISKSKVAPIKKLAIPHSELCGAHCTIVLSWLIGNPRRFKVYVSNRVSSIIEHIHQIIGTMFMVWKTQLTMYLEDFSPHNCWIVEYGEKDLLGQISSISMASKREILLF